MKRSAVVLLVLAFAPPLGAQEADEPAGPVLEVDFKEAEAVPGQPLSLRLTVLVPTFMPKPPVWPSLEAPNLLVRLPEGSTGPTSKRIGGQTWSGITRHYRISPMVPGDFAIPPQEVMVTFADPDTNEPTKATLSTEPLAFSGVVPVGAEGLDPFLAAEALKLEQEITGDPETMAPGESVTRTVTARIRGTSPMFLPDLLPAMTVEGLAAYADEPALAEADDRGVLSGTRTERVTLVAEGGGSGEAPPVSLDWYNLKTGKVETATLEGFAISVDGPPARSAEPRDWRVIALTALAGALAVALALWLLRRLLPPLGRWVRARRADWLASEARAYARLRQVAKHRDHAALRPALDAWAAKVSGPDPRRDARLQDALRQLGAARYGVFRHAGIEPTAKRYLLIKSRQHFRAGFEPIARHVVLVSGPGVTSSDYDLFRWTKVPRPLYPLDPEMARPL
jgi:MlrC C-terminus